MSLHGDRDTMEEGLRERPGNMRLIDIPPGEEVFESQVRIFTKNNIRTYDYRPRLKSADYLPAELQQVCILREDEANDRVEWDCLVQPPPCDGFQIDDTRLRVQQIQSGTSVTHKGVNFIDVNAKIQFHLKHSTESFTEVDTFVYGDIDTPLTESINAADRILNDSRVHYKIFFPIPIAPGIYEFMVVVPNASRLENFGDKIVSNVQYLEVETPSSARFQIATERLWARKETYPQSLGTDEVRVKTYAKPLFTDGTLGNSQQSTFRFGDFDSGETREMDDVIFSHNWPTVGLILVFVQG